MTAAVITAAEANLVGKDVIAWGWEGTFLYKGDDGSTGERVIFSAGPRAIQTSFQRVAPADVVVPPRDIRVNVTKGDMRTARACGHYGRGAWMLDLPGRRTTWHNTKREAMDAGLRRCAILDWHASLS